MAVDKSGYGTWKHSEVRSVLHFVYQLSVASVVHDQAPPLRRLPLSPRLQPRGSRWMGAQPLPGNSNVPNLPLLCRRGGRIRPADATHPSAHALAWLPASASTPAWRPNRLMAAQLACCAPAGWVRLAVSPLLRPSISTGAHAARFVSLARCLARKYGLRQIVNAWPTGPNNGSSISI
jgi:hypothetical protein